MLRVLALLAALAAAITVAARWRGRVRHGSFAYGRAVFGVLLLVAFLVCVFRRSVLGIVVTGSVIVLLAPARSRA